MFLSASQIGRQFAFQHDIPFVISRDDAATLIPSNLVDGLVTELTFTSNDSAAAEIDVMVFDPTGINVVLGTVPLPAPVAPATLSSIDALAALGGGVTAAILLPIGWKLGARLQVVPAVGTVTGYANLGVV